MGTREQSIDSGLQHFTTLLERRQHYGVMIPLAHYIRNNRESADDFICRKFREHRVTAIGENHSSDEVSGLSENVCVRLFIRDLVLRLYRDDSANLKFFCLEIDESLVTPPLESMTIPAGIVNRKAHWFAQYCEREGSEQPAYIEILRAISRTCSEERLEVVGIDCQYIDGQVITQGYMMGSDIPEDTPAEEREQELQRRTALFRRREEATEHNFQGVLDRMQPEERALIFYGVDHLREATISPISAFDRLDPRSFVQRLAGSLSPDDIYTVVTAYEGLPTPTDDILHPGMNAKLQDVREYDFTLARIYDLLRAEFDDHSLGFDIDEAENHRILLHLSRRHRLGEVYDGYLFFRNLNSWNGSARLSGPRQTERTNPPPLRVTRVVPNAAILRPQIIIFVYGHFFEPVPRVSVGDESCGFHACTDVRLINQNVLQTQVPESAFSEFGNNWIDVKVERDYTTNVLESIGHDDEAVEDSTTDEDLALIESAMDEYEEDSEEPGSGQTSSQTQEYTLRNGFRHRVVIF